LFAALAPRASSRGSARNRTSPARQACRIPQKIAAVSGNPAATNVAGGIGWLGRTLGLKDEWGVHPGRVLAGRLPNLVVAAAAPSRRGWTNNSAFA
jgi:hypothetical protein